MGHSNTTNKIKLPLFVGTDKPSWMTDFNGAMNTLDSAVGASDSAAAGALSTANAAHDLAVNAQNAADDAAIQAAANADEIAAIKAEGIAAVKVPVTFDPAYFTGESKIACYKQGSMIMFTASMIYTTSAAIVDTDNFKTVFTITNAHGFTISAGARNYPGTIAQLLIDGGADEYAYAPVVIKPGMVGGENVIKVTIHDYNGALKAATSGASKVRIYCSGCFPIVLPG